MPRPARPSPRLAAALMCAALLAGCSASHVSRGTGLAASGPDSASHSEAPIAGNFPTRIQAHLQAGQHWQRIAEDTAQQLADALARAQRCGPRFNPCQPVYLADPERPSEFSRAFGNALLTALVQRGLAVAQFPDGALVAQIDVQPVRFAANRPQYRRAGIAREVGPGIWALEAPDAPTQGATDAPVAGWFHPEFSAGATPRSEILVTVSVLDGGRYAARSTQVYYVSEDDRTLYDQALCTLIRPCPESAAPGAPAAQPLSRKALLSITGDCPLDKPCCPPGQVCPGQIQP